MVEQEFTALKTFGQFLSHGLLDHTRARETDQRIWLRDVDVAEHGETGGNAARRRIRQYRDKRHACVAEIRERR